METKHWTDSLHKIVMTPLLQFSIGSILLFISITEVFFRPSHGIMIIGAYHIFQALPNILQALERIARWRRKKGKV